MRTLALLSVVSLLACGAAPTEAIDVCATRALAPASSQLKVGVAHVAGAYAPKSSEHFLLAGATQAQELGASTLKVYLTPEYRTKYPGEWPTVGSLESLAKTPAFEALFARPFDTFVITAYTFASGVGDPWRESDDPRLYDAEANELESLTRHLLTRYSGTGKTFVLQNWEGDWALLAGAGVESQVPAARVARMRRWLEARQLGVARARETTAHTSVQVLNAAEANRVLDAANHTRVVSDVLPGLCVDAVSYSAWEALDAPRGLELTQEMQWVRTQLTSALAALRDAALPGTLQLMGELGFAEAERTAGTTGPLVSEALAVAREEGLSHAVYWQLYDNECTGEVCRGFWVVRPDGSLSEAGRTLPAQMSAIR